MIIASAINMQQIGSTVITTALPQTAMSLHTDPVRLGAGAFGQPKRTETMVRSLSNSLSSFILILFAIAVGTLPAQSQEAKAEPSIAAKPGEWRYLNSDPLGTRYSPLDQINKD